MFDDMEKTEGRPIVEEGYYPYREDDEFDVSLHCSIAYLPFQPILNWKPVQTLQTQTRTDQDLHYLLTGFP